MGFLDTAYTNGVIAVREKKLIKDKLKRLCELSAEDAFRALLESGFGGGAETTASVYEYEKLIEREERDVDEFIKEYAPSETEKIFLLSARDFHNAKAYMKAAYLNTEAERFLAPDGLIEKSFLYDCITEKNYAEIKVFNAYLGGACEEADGLLQEEPSGAKLGEIFEKALYRHLAATAGKRTVLRKLLRARADMTNILIALRCGEEELAKEKYLPCGTLKEDELAKLFDDDYDRAVKAFADTDYAEFVKSCFLAKAQGKPFTQAERMLGGLDVEYFDVKKYDLKKNEPFLYYVYRRRIENANVRIVFACLLAGQNEHDIKNRLRGL